MYSGYIDRYPYHLLAHVHSLADIFAYLVIYIEIQKRDALILLKYRNEVIGEDNPAVHFLPSDKSLRTINLIGPQVNLRLHIYYEFMITERILHITCICNLTPKLLTHLFTVDNNSGAIRKLGSLTCHIGIGNNILKRNRLSTY